MSDQVEILIGGEIKESDLPEFFELIRNSWLTPKHYVEGDLDNEGMLTDIKLSCGFDPYVIEGETNEWQEVLHYCDRKNLSWSARIKNETSRYIQWSVPGNEGGTSADEDWESTITVGSLKHWNDGVMTLDAVIKLLEVPQIPPIKII